MSSINYDGMDGRENKKTNCNINNLQKTETVNKKKQDVYEDYRNIPKKDECPDCFHKISKEDKECPYCGRALSKR